MYKLILLFVLVTLSSCLDFLNNDKEDGDVKNNQTQSEFVLKYGEKYTLPNGEVITFTDVIEDSRCPTDVDCVWEGNFKMTISSDNSIKEINTNLEPKSIDINGIILIIDSVEPKAMSEVKIEKSQYKVKFKLN